MFVILDTIHIGYGLPALEYISIPGNNQPHPVFSRLCHQIGTTLGDKSISVAEAVIGGSTHKAGFHLNITDFNRFKQNRH